MRSAAIPAPRAWRTEPTAEQGCHRCPEKVSMHPVFPSAVTIRLTGSVSRMILVRAMLNLLWMYVRISRRRERTKYTWMGESRSGGYSRRCFLRHSTPRTTEPDICPMRITVVNRPAASSISCCQFGSSFIHRSLAFVMSIKFPGDDLDLGSDEMPMAPSGFIR